MIGSSSLCQHPCFPVGTEPLELSVGAHIDGNTIVGKFFTTGRYEEVSIDIFFFRYHHAMTGARINNSSGSKSQQSFFGPYIGMLIPVVLATHGTVRNN